MNVDSPQLPQFFDKIIESVNKLFEYEDKLTTRGGRDCYSEVISYLENCKSLHDVSGLRVSEKVQERTRYLLNKNNESFLTEEEEQELDEYQELNHLSTLIKANAKKESLVE